MNEEKFSIKEVPADQKLDARVRRGDDTTAFMPVVAKPRRRRLSGPSMPCRARANVHEAKIFMGLRISSAQLCQFARTIHVRSEMEKVAAWMRQEMLTNSTGPEAKQIRSDLTIPGQMYDFYQLVCPGGKWDHKAQIVKRFNKWSCDYSVRTAYRYDIWSNIHYAYIGRSVGFGRWLLEAGAGAAQTKAGTVPDSYWSRRSERIGDADVLSALDDPLDLEAVRLGMDLWDAHGNGLTLVQLVDGVRARSRQLATTLCQASCKVVRSCPTPIIVLDPGHGKGSKNVGASVVLFDKNKKPHNQDPKRTERDLVLKVAEALKTELEKRGYTVYLTRSSENYVKHDPKATNDLEDRILFSSGARADYFISLHADGEEKGTDRGSHACYRGSGVAKDGVPKLVELAQDIMSHYTIVPVLKESPKLRNDLRVLSSDNAARYRVLVELGFASTASEWDTLDKGAAQAASELAKGLDVNIARHRDEFSSVEQEQPY